MTPPVKTTQIALAIGESDAPLTMSSLEISELTGKRHGDVIRDIRVMIDALQGDDAVLRHVREDKDARGYTTAFRLDRELTDTLLTGYNIPLRRRVVARWHELEAKAAQPMQPPVALPHDFISALEHLLESKKAEQLAITQRDEAIRTKAQIGSKREATAMATAAAAKRQTDKLKEQLGFCAKHASVIAVEKATGKKFAPQDWRKLRAWCLKHGVMAITVPDTRWGEAKAWPAGAWLEMFGVDLTALFGEVAA